MLRRELPALLTLVVGFFMVLGPFIPARHFTAARTELPEAEAARALTAFDPVWTSLTPREQGRVIDLLVERVEYDGADGTVAVTFRPAGIKTLADELAQEHDDQPREKRA